MAYEREKLAAVEAVERACRVCRSVRETLVSAETVAKKDRSPVTVADFGGQAVVSLALLAAFPEDRIVGEEDAAELRSEEPLRARVLEAVASVLPHETEDRILDAIDQGTYSGGPSGRHWALDPIDGTKGFLRNEQYAVALALIEDGEVVLGVLGCPNLPLSLRDPEGKPGCLFVASRGDGTRMRSLSGGSEAPVGVSAIGHSAAAAFCESVEAGHSSHADAARVAELLGVTAPPIRMDSQAKYGVLARGDASLYLRLPVRADYEEKIWDHAAGWIVIREAGGEVTDVDGKPLDFSLGRTLSSNRGVIASNGRLHAQAVAAVRRVLGARTP